MKRSFSKLALWGFFLIAPSAFAGALYSPTANNIPSLSPGFEFDLSALYLQPNSNDLDYAILTSPFPLQTPNWDVQSINPDYHFGFDVGLRYVFSNATSDAQLDWLHLDTNDSAFVHADSSQFVAPSYEVGPPAGSIREASANAAFNFDSINLDVGVYKNLGNRTQMRFFGGLNVSYIKQDLTTTFQDDAPTFAVTSENLSKFTGIGPRVGANATYYIAHGFGIVGQVAAAALIGTMHTETNFTSFSPELQAVGISTNYQQIDDDNTTQVVPEMDAKLGLEYIHPFGKEGTIKFELGYQAAIYINAINEVYPTSVVSPIQTGTVAVAAMGQSQSDFNEKGAYFRVAFKM